MMWDGKKSICQKIFYDMIDTIKKKIPQESPLQVFETAINNCKPEVEVRSQRIGGATYQIPVPINQKRQTSLAMRWIIQAARKKKGKPMFIKLAEEIIDAFKNTGAAVTTKINVHKMAEANKTFAHFAR